MHVVWLNCYYILLIAGHCWPHIYVSDDARQVLVVVGCCEVYVWQMSGEASVPQFTNSVRLAPLAGQWSHVLPQDGLHLPTADNLDLTIHASFFTNEVALYYITIHVLSSNTYLNRANFHIHYTLTIVFICIFNIGFCFILLSFVLFCVYLCMNVVWIEYVSSTVL